jgi:dephospho-CoA kinase
MDVYGLTGGIGSGKSTVAELLEEYGVPVVSADELSRVVVAPGSEGLRMVVEKFGTEILGEDGGLDRRRMASMVFRDPERRRELEAILHPRIRDRFEQVLDALEKAGHEVAVYEVPLLFERNLQGEMKAVILVTAPMSVRVARVRARDDVTETEVRARIAAQMDEDAKRRRADYIIENNGSLDELRREVEFLMARFLRIPAATRRAEAAASPREGITITGMTMPPTRTPGEGGDEPLPSRRPTAVPTAAPASITAPVEAAIPLLEPDDDEEDEDEDMGGDVGVHGPPTIVETGPAARAASDAVPSMSSGTQQPAVEGVPADARITRIDSGPPTKR